MKTGSRTFEIQLEYNPVAKKFVNFAAGKELKMQKYGLLTADGIRKSHLSLL